MIKNPLNRIKVVAYVRL